MEHAFMKKRLEKHLNAVITEAMAAIHIISEAGIEEMKARGIDVNKLGELDGAFRAIGVYAADRLEMDAEGLSAEYKKLLFFAGLIEYVDNEEVGA